MSDRDAAVLVLLLVFVPVFAVVRMSADFFHPSRSNWAIALVAGGAAILAGFWLAVAHDKMGALAFGQSSALSQALTRTHGAERDLRATDDERC